MKKYLRKGNKNGRNNSINIKRLYKQYDKVNTMNVGIMPNGKNVIYKKIKMTETQKLIFEQYIEMKGE